MSYRVLARKWRPKTFSELVGQSHVLQALENALQQGRIHHAYLLTGTRGVGKTTIARILARCFNCEKGPTASPCGVCGSCTEISEGRNLDLIEVDAASRTKVEDTRELLENSQFAPSQGRYKIYLIDEVHMLSNHSFNALLKTLEEPPEHVIFIFATTHPQKIPVTVLSRCLQFHLKNIVVEQISGHLDFVLGEEDIRFDSSALEMIAHAAQGSMRDALSITEQAIAFGQGEVRVEQVKSMLGMVDADVTASLIRSVLAADHQQAFSVLREHASKSLDFGVLVDDLLQILHRVALEQLQTGLGAEGQIQRDAIIDIAAKTDPTFVQIMYQGILLGKRDLQLAPDPITGMEMLLLRLLAFRPLEAGLVASQSETSAATHGDHQALEEGAAPAKKPVISPSRAEQFTESGTDNKAAATPSTDDVRAPQTVDDASPDIAAEAVRLAEFDNAAWCQSFSMLPLAGLVRAVLENCIFHGQQDVSAAVPKLSFKLEQRRADLFKPEHAEKLAAALSIFFGEQVDADIELVEQLGSDETPVRYREREQQKKQDGAIRSVEQDANVKKIIDTFSGSLNRESIQLLNSD